MKRQPRPRPHGVRLLAGENRVHGRDPNWGRIVAAAGRAGVPMNPDAVALWLGEHQLMAAGQPLAFDRAAASAYMRERAASTYLVDDTVVVRLVVGQGSGAAMAWGCDLSDQHAHQRRLHHSECAVDRDLVIHQRLVIPAAELAMALYALLRPGRAERQQVGNGC